MKKLLILFLFISTFSFGQTEIFRYDSTALFGNKTPKGIEYLEYGKVGDPLIIYLHGVGQVGTNPAALIYQSPVCAKWPTGFQFPEFFTKGIRIVAPVLKSGSWTPAYIDSFLDEINTTNLVCLMGWSWGGEGVGIYLNQITKKHEFKCGVLISKSGKISGTNVSCPVRMVHATNDGTCHFSNSDTFYSGVPEKFKGGYARPDGGDHWVWISLLDPSSGIYEWIKSFSQIITYTEVKIEKGSDGKLYINENGNRILFN